MRIAYVHVSSSANDGSSKALVVMLKGLMQKGVQPLVVLPATGDLYQQMLSIGVPCFVTPYRMNIYPKLKSFTDCLLFLPRIIVHQYLNTKAVFRLYHKFKDERIDVVHTNVGVLDVGFRAAKKLHIPHFFHIREYADLDFGMHYFPFKCLFRNRLSHKDCYSICITRDIQQYHGQAASSHSRVIYDAICPPRFNFPEVHFGNYFLFAGRVQYTKGLDVLLQAYVLCRKRNVPVLPLWVAGSLSDENYVAQIQRFIDNHALSEDVTLLGNRVDIEKLMAEARALVVPSRYEGFGLCMPEAMFNATLVIAHDTAGTHEQLENGLREAGQEIAMRFQTIEQLASILELVSAASREDYIPMIQRAFSVVNSLYTTESNTRQIYQFYQEILSS